MTPPEGSSAAPPAGEPSGSATVAERLRAAYPRSSRRTLKQWLAGGRVEVNGRVVRDGRAPVAPADRLALRASGSAAFPAQLGRVFEDRDILVVDKPPGLLTIATDREKHRTVYRLLSDYLAASRPRQRLFIVHRLDRETSGLLVLAKSPAAKQALQAQFEQRTAERVYVALVEGSIERDTGRLESRLHQDRSLRVRPGRSGRLAITHYRVLERRRHATLIELALSTGRRHQLRVQLAELGHPIAGDRAHGSRTDPFGRLALHARRLGFAHPSSGEALSFDSAPPAGWV